MDFREMSNDEYHADRTAVSKSWLDRIAQSPAHLRHYLDGPRKPKTPALVFGGLLHAMLEDNLTDYAIEPELNKRTNAGKLDYQIFRNSNQGKQIVTCQQMDQAKAMRDSIMRCSTARALYSKGEAEKTLFWEDFNGLACKARADWYREDLGLIVDLKTTVSADPKAFARSIYTYRYHVQDAHYSAGFHVEQFLFLVVEKEPPYSHAFYYLDHKAKQWGAMERDKNLALYDLCLRSDSWPGYSSDPIEVTLPHYAAPELDDTIN